MFIRAFLKALFTTLSFAIVTPTYSWAQTVAPASELTYKILWSRKIGGWNKLLAFAPTGDLLVSSSNSVEKVASSDGNSLGSFSLCDYNPIVSPTSQGSLFVLCEETIEIVAMSSGQGMKTVPRGNSTRMLSAIRDPPIVASTGTMTAVADFDGAVRIYDNTNLGVLKNTLIPGHATALIFSPRGEKLYIASVNGSISIWDLVTDKVQELPHIRSSDEVDWIALSPSGEKLLMKTDSFEGSLYEIPSGRAMATIKTGSWIQQATFLTESRFVAAGSDGLALYSFPQTQPSLLIDGTTQERIAVRNDGEMICSGDRDGLITCLTNDPNAVLAQVSSSPSGANASSSGTVPSPATDTGQRVEDHHVEDHDDPVGFEGVLTARQDKILTFEMNEMQNAPGVENTCTVSRYFTNNSFGIDISGWMQTVKAEIVSVQDKTVSARIAEILSEGTVNGKQTDFLNVQDRIRLECETAVK